MTKSTNWKEQFISSRGFFLATRAGSPILWRIAHWTLSLLTPDSPGTFSLSSLTVSLGLLRSLFLTAAIILLVSFLPTPASDLFFLGAALREIPSQSPDALAAATQSLWVLSGIPVNWRISGGLCFPPFLRNNTDFRVPGDAWLLAWRVMLTMTQHFKIPALYRHQLLRLLLTAHRPPSTNHNRGAALPCSDTVNRPRSEQLSAGKRICRTGIFL